MHHIHETVDFYPETPKRGQEVIINYDGILAQNGADAVWLHYGHDNWQDSSYKKMERQENKFSCKIEAEGRKSINFCFKDSADHWDNNNGMDWGCPIK